MSNLKVNTINDANGGSGAVLYGVASPPNSMGFRNRIINGSMVVDQRNNGASVGGFGYRLDRWSQFLSAGAFTTQQVTDAPSGFSKSMKITTTTASAGAVNVQFQNIEGLNTADLAFGSAVASTVTVSFWIKSTVTGTFSGKLGNGTLTRSYVFTYAINAANTWEFKTVTIPGDTTGTWATDNSTGISLVFCIGTGGTTVAAGSWQAGDNIRTSSSVGIEGTLNATWQITGVQLEAGTVATPFERRDYGRELMMCQRYYETGATKLYLNISATLMAMATEYKVTKRAAATLVYSSPPAGGYAPPTAQEWSDINGFAGNRNSTQELAYSWAASAEL